MALRYAPRPALLLAHRPALLFAALAQLVLVSLGVPPTTAQVDHWQQVRPSGRQPPGLQWASGVYDETEHRMLMFGGTDQDVDYNDVWSLNLESGNEAWTLLRPAGQPPYYRRHAAAAFDPIANRMVVFGGYNDDREVFYDETWILAFRGGDSEWDKLPPTGDRPDRRRGATLVRQYVAEALPAVHRLILFGGHDADRSFDDVWAFDLTPGQGGWTELTPEGKAPKKRDSHVAVYDPVGNRMIVYSGWDGTRGSVPMNDVWALDLTPGAERWDELSPDGTAPPAIGWASAVFDPCPGRERMLVFGGYMGTRSLSDTQALSLASPGNEVWSRLDPTGARPRPRDSNAAVYEPLGRRIIIYGGWDGPGDLKRDTWALELSPCLIPTPTETVKPPDTPTPEHTPTTEPIQTDTPVATLTQVPSPSTTGPAATWTPRPTATQRVGPMLAYLPLAVRGHDLRGSTSPGRTTICDPGFEMGRFGPVSASHASLARGGSSNLAPPSVDLRAVEAETLMRNVTRDIEPTGPATELSGPATELTGPATELSGPAIELSGPAGEVSTLTRSQSAKLGPALHHVYELLRDAGKCGGDPCVHSSEAAPVDWATGRTYAVPSRIAGDTSLRALVSTTDVEGLEQLGVTVRGRIDDVVAVTLRAETLDDLARMSSVAAIDAPALLEAANDRGRADARVPEVVAATGATGAGVIVAVIDSGIDFTHDSFIDGEGRTRLLGMLDMAEPGDQDADGDLDGEGPGGGTVHTQAEIQAALRDEISGAARVYDWPGDPKWLPDYGVSNEAIVIGPSDATTIRTMHLQLKVTHSRLEHLQMKLKTPDGASYDLPRATNPSQVDLIASFEIKRLNGLSTEGRWTLSIDDREDDGRQGGLYWWRLHVNRSVREEDIGGHGTHVAGTAAGDDAPVGADRPGEYAGVAPQADLLVVRAKRDLATYAEDDVVVALGWVESQADVLHEPYVVNMSFGGPSGAHDGSDPMERGVDGLVGPGKEGRAAVIAVGNSGDKLVHAGGEFTPSDDTVHLDLPDEVESELIHIWFGGPATTRIGVEPPDGYAFSCTSMDYWGDNQRDDCSRLVLGPGDPLRYLRFERDGETVAWGEVSFRDRDRHSGKYQVAFALYGDNDWYLAPGNWRVALYGARGRWDAWSFYGEPFANGDSDMTVGVPATSQNAVAVGSHTTRKHWTDSKGNRQDLPGVLGGISSFSSRGPTADGRSKPDLTAPGEWVISAQSSSAQFADSVRTSAEHAVLAGTSMAAPHVTGAIALLMSMPGGEELDAPRLKGLLQDAARRDAATGSSPDPNMWGAGKLDLLATLEEWKGVQPSSTPYPTATLTPVASLTRAPTSTSSTTPEAVTATPGAATATTARPTPTSPAPPPATPTAVGGGDVCWVDGGELVRQVVGMLDDDQPPFAGNYSAELGDPSLGAGLPGGSTVPVGSAWVEQTVTIPDTDSVGLTFWYRMITYDVAQDALGHVWDVFAVSVDGVEAFSDGNGTDAVPGTRREIGWRRQSLDMSQWRGKTVTIRFANWNGRDGGFGADTYNTWTYLDEVHLTP